MRRHHVIETRRDGVLERSVAAASAGGVEQIRLVLVEQRRMIEVSEKIAEKHFLVRRHLIIDARDILLFLVVVCLRERIPPAAVRIQGRIGDGDHAEDLQRKRMEQCRIHLVIDKWRAKRPRCTATACRRHHSREVSPKHFRRGNELVGSKRCHSIVRGLNAAKEEQLVMHDRSAEGAAELIAVETVVSAAAAVFFLFEKADRIEFVIAHEIEHVAVEAVRSGLRHGIDRRAGGHAVSRVAHTALSPEFLECVRKWKDIACIQLRIIVVAPVNQILRAVARTARDGNGHLPRVTPISRCCATRIDGPLKQQQLRRLATVER